MKQLYSISAVAALLGTSWNAIDRAYTSGGLRSAVSYVTATKGGRPLFTVADVTAYRDRMLIRLETYPPDKARSREIKKLRAAKLPA